MIENGKEKEPRTLNVRKSDLEFYHRLLAEDSPFNGMDNKRIFLLAMATGFFEEKFADVKDMTSFCRTETLIPEERALIDAIAVYKEGSLDVLSNPRKVFEIAEGYASGGIRSLYEQVFEGEFGTYSKRLEAELRSIVEKMGGGIKSDSEEKEEHSTRHA